MIRTEVVCVYYTRDILTLTCHYNNGYLAVLSLKIHLPDTIVQRWTIVSSFGLEMFCYYCQTLIRFVIIREVRLASEQEI